MKVTLLSMDADADAMEILKTDFHCPLDDRKLDEYDPIRSFNVEQKN